MSRTAARATSSTRRRRPSRCHGSCVSWSSGCARTRLSIPCLYRSGYDLKRLFTLSEFYDRDRSAFYAALQAVRERQMDLTGWLEFFVNGLAVQMQEVKKRGTAVIRADVVARIHGLGVRAAAVLAAIHEAEMMSLADLEPLFPRVSRRSLQRDLRLLLEKALILDSGNTATTDPNRSYVPVKPRG